MDKNFHILGCWASNVFGALFFAAATSSIVVSSLGLRGQLSLKAVSIANLSTALVHPVLGVPQLIVSILGIYGVTTMRVVSGVTLASASVALMVAPILACSGCICGCRCCCK